MPFWDNQNVFCIPKSDRKGIAIAKKIFKKLFFDVVLTLNDRKNECELLMYCLRRN